MDVERHYKSITDEMEALKSRVRNFIEGRHWLTDGEWKESVLRTVISQRLPETVKIGRGFVLVDGGATTQCDILLYRSNCPILFRDGDLVFLTPDALLGVVEVKSSVDASGMQKALKKLSCIGEQLGTSRTDCILGLFAYESRITNDGLALDAMEKACRSDLQVVDIVSLGCDRFIKWWLHSPNIQFQHRQWHLYDLPHMAAGYFIMNLIDFVCPDSVQSNDRLWFPSPGKEDRRIASIAMQTQ